MKQSIILWIAAAVITFLAGFLQSRLSNEYPVSGSFGIEGKEIGYKLDKVYYGKDAYTFFIRSEIDSLKGEVKWKDDTSDQWKSSELIRSGTMLAGLVPHKEPTTRTEYYITLSYKNKSYSVPPNKMPVVLTFYGKIPSPVNIYYWLTLFGLLLMGVRTGLEYFHIPGKMKKLNVFTLIFVVVNVFVFHPLRTTYKLDAVGKSTVAFTDMFPLSSLFILAVWIIATALIFNTKNFRIWAPVAAILTLIIFEIGQFT